MYTEITKQGYKVIDTIGDYTILKRPSDYAIAYLYDASTGTWAQGHYMFESLLDCVDWLRETERV